MALWQLLNLGTGCKVTHCWIALWSHQSAQTTKSERSKYDFTFDARQRCRQICNLLAYSFDFGKGEVKLATTLTSPLTRVKDEVK